MRKGSIVALSVAAGVVIGCAVASSPLVFPPARAGTTPQKWEYTCFKETNLNEITKKSNRAGSQGWEMVTVMDFRWCFKRPLP